MEGTSRFLTAYRSVFVMKVSIGMKLQHSPWGGGNQFGHAFAKYLRNRNHEVCFDLADKDIDIILLAEPRRDLRISAYSEYDIVRKIILGRSRALIVHRVNECDERKGTTDVNERLRQAAKCADAAVFVSNWLKDLHNAQGFPCRQQVVILNGADRDIFSSQGYRPWNGSEPLRLVTHHWSSHPMKGFHFYRYIDTLLDSGEFKGILEYTYIGNLPEGFSFTRARHLQPLYGLELAAALRHHHVYVTASQNEPGPNHQNEAACCGLPILYLQSGALPEYCEGFGIGFTETTFSEKLREMMATYHQYVEKMRHFPYTAQAMSMQYEKLFQSLLKRKKELLKNRQWIRRPLWLLRMLCGTGSSQR